MNLNIIFFNFNSIFSLFISILYNNKIDEDKIENLRHDLSMIARMYGEFTVDPEAKIFFWHRPPYNNDEIWETHEILAKIPANPLPSTGNNQYFECFDAVPKDQCKAKSKDQN